MRYGWPQGSSRPEPAARLDGAVATCMTPPTIVPWLRYGPFHPNSFWGLVNRHWYSVSSAVAVVIALTPIQVVGPGHVEVCVRKVENAFATTSMSPIARLFLASS